MNAAAGLSGRTAIVTGAASGIGLATANALADAGASVTGLDIQASAQTRFPLRHVDITDTAGVREAMSSFAVIDIVVNCADIDISATLADLGRAGSSAYCATKGAVLSLTRSWARELAPRILVNAVAPGPIDTPLLHFDTMPPELQALETANPLGRIGRAEEVAAVVLFLAGPGASFITGQCYGVDGGDAMRCDAMSFHK